MLYEEDIDRAVAEAIRLLGPMGNMLVNDGNHVHYNICVKTPLPKEYVIWWGDVREEDLRHIEGLAKLLRVKELIVEKMS